MQIRSIIGGDISGPIRDLLRRGTPATGPIEHLDQGWAVAYVLAAEAGVIKDKKATATVTMAFNITPRTLQRWKKEQTSHGIHWRALVPDNVQEDKVGEFLKSRMREAGARYLQKGPLATTRKKPDPYIAALRREHR
jgi:hypothetical protein